MRGVQDRLRLISPTGEVLADFTGSVQSDAILIVGECPPLRTGLTIQYLPENGVPISYEIKNWRTINSPGFGPCTAVPIPSANTIQHIKEEINFIGPVGQAYVKSTIDIKIILETKEKRKKVLKKISSLELEDSQLEQILESVAADIKDASTDADLVNAYDRLRGLVADYSSILWPLKDVLKDASEQLAKVFVG